jgi:hypothetical protein
MSSTTGSAGGAFLPGSTYDGTTLATLTSPIMTDPTVSGTSVFTGTISNNNTLTAASYAPSSHVDELIVSTTLTPATTVTAANGLNSIRGGMTLTAGKTLGDGNASYVTAVYGRGDIHGTVNIGSGDLAAVYAKFDLSSATLTSGHIAPLQANIVNPVATSEATTDLIYAESASGTRIKSVLSGYAAAAFGFDFTDVGTSNWLPAISSTTLNGLNIKVKLNGTTYYIKTGTAA